MIRSTTLVGLLIFCWQSHAAGIGEPCLIDTDCNPQTPYSYCNDREGVCTCIMPRAHFPEIPGKCLMPARKIGDSCFQHAYQCSNIPRSFCDSSFTCRCNETTRVKDPSLTKCLPKAGFRANCEHSIQCQEEHTFCDPILRRCECDKFHIKSETSNTCLPIASAVGSNCSQHNQCAFSGSRSGCNLATSKCECSPTAITINGKCYRKQGFMEECEFTEQCTPPNSKCIYNSKLALFLCDCPKASLRASGQCYPIKRIGDDCKTSEDCTVSGSSCSSSKCTCEHYAVSNDRTKCLPKQRLNEPCEESAQCVASENTTIFCGPSGLCASPPDTDNSGVKQFICQSHFILLFITLLLIK